MPIVGQRQSRLTSRLKALVISGAVWLDVQGRTGKQLVVEASSNLIDWVWWEPSSTRPEDKITDPAVAGTAVLRVVVSRAGRFAGGDQAALLANATGTLCSGARPPGRTGIEVFGSRELTWRE